MPGPGSSSLRTFYSLATEPVFKGILPGVYREIFKPKRPDNLEDESVGAFLSRRFGKPIADNIASAVFHGIYAGDVYQLSVRSIMPYLWETESRHRSVVKGAWDRTFGGLASIADEDIELVRHFGDRPPQTAKLEEIKSSSIFTFKGGIGELASTLEAKLQENPNVNIQQQTRIKELELNTEGPFPMVYHP